MMFSEAYSEPSQSSKMEIFAKIVNSFSRGKSFDLDVWQGSDCISVFLQFLSTASET